MRVIFQLRLRGTTDPMRRDRVMAPFAPVSLLVLLPTWLALVLVGYAGMFWSLGVRPWRQAAKLSGSSLLTLGFADVQGWLTTLLSFSEAIIGLVLVAVLIAYLPTMYAAFSRREAAVAKLEVRAGDPPSAVELIARSHRIGRLEHLGELWASWESWFADIEETHTSLGALAFFRSPLPGRSWITASAAILDAAAFHAAVLDVPRDTRADLCIRAGYVALRRIADLFHISYDPDPRPDDPISISRADFDAAYNTLARQGVPLKPHREQCWLDFAGWRVNYDSVLLDLADLLMAPDAPWTGTRSVRPKRPHLFASQGR
jgi:hypothetical protein